ncbi:MAG: polysaccharide biosynthesis/export family protein [Desulfobacteraceae bacterium]|nr:polysaccharide biosynthesis/export family protein [Desulfobacteraceae bacterium]
MEYKQLLPRLGRISLIAAAMLMMVGCGGLPKDYAMSSQTMHQNTQSAAYKINKGDTIEVKFPYTENFNEDVIVRTDGQISTRVAGEFEAADLTTAQLGENIRQRASARLKDPMVVINVKNSALKVYVGGEVGTPGFVGYRDGITALQAVFERGGFRDSAQWDKLIVFRTENNETKRIELGVDAVASASLSPSDVIFVQKSGMAKAGLAVKQIRDLLPVPTGASMAMY